MGVLIFFLLSIVSVGAILGALISRNQAYTALFLVLALSGLAGLFGLLDAPFIAVVQLIIYAGAIMVLFIFVIMLIRLPEGIPPEKKKGTIIVAVVLGLALGIEVYLALAGSSSGAIVATQGAGLGHPTAIGRLLLTDYLYPFELTSVLLLAALVGALILAKKREAS
jgi:NADH-quinone oxidoreductase subunit J